MHNDLRELPEKSELNAHLCIVGAGIAGIAMAMDWISEGKSVLLLESGGFDTNRRTQLLNQGVNVGQKYYDLVTTRLRYFGGTGNHWTGLCPKMDPIDFKERPWIPNTGWPIEYTEVEKYYEDAMQFLEINKSEDPEIEVNSLVESEYFHPKLFRLSPPTRPGNIYRQSIVESTDIHLITFANLVRIDLNKNLNKVDRIVVKSLNNKVLNVTADKIVLTMGTLQNTRVLLANDHQVPQGVGNENDLVGRHFMEHLEVETGQIFSEGQWDHKPFEINRRRSSWYYELATTEKLQEEGTLNTTLSLANYTNSIQTKIRMEQAPNKNSRVMLNDERDELGIPLIKLDWQLTDLERRSVQKIMERLGIELIQSRAGRLKLREWVSDPGQWPQYLRGGWHHMGTLRMSSDPGKGVVDANCKVHAYDNLYVAGSAVFPTSGSANPTLTLTALTLRLSEYLKRID